MVANLLLALILLGATDRNVRTLEFVHTHTSETVRVAYAVDGVLVPDAVATLNRFLRDHRNGEVIEIDPKLFDLLWTIRQRAGVDGPFHLISGYRSAQTNEMLRSQGRQVGKYSMHVKGQAIDIRLPGVPTSTLRKIATELKAGGVGYYPNSDFIHVDTGRVRYW